MDNKVQFSIKSQMAYKNKFEGFWMYKNAFNLIQILWLYVKCQPKLNFVLEN